MDPFSMILAGTIFNMAGNLFSGFSEYRTRKANAAILRRQSDDRIRKSVMEADELDARFRRHLGRNIARAGVTGIDLRSFYDVLAADTTTAELEKMKIRWTGEQEAYYLRYQAANQVQMGRDAMFGGVLKAAGSVVTGARLGLTMESPFAAPTMGWEPVVSQWS
jgi:hypothetical protein